MAVAEGKKKKKGGGGEINTVARENEGRQVERWGDGEGVCVCGGGGGYVEG